MLPSPFTEFSLMQSAEQQFEILRCSPRKPYKYLIRYGLRLYHGFQHIERSPLYQKAWQTKEDMMEVGQISEYSAESAIEAYHGRAFDPTVGPAPASLVLKDNKGWCTRRATLMYGSPTPRRGDQPCLVKAQDDRHNRAGRIQASMGTEEGHLRSVVQPWKDESSFREQGRSACCSASERESSSAGCWSVTRDTACT